MDDIQYAVEVQKALKKIGVHEILFFSREFESSKVGDSYLNSFLDFHCLDTELRMRGLALSLFQGGVVLDPPSSSLWSCMIL